MTADTWTILGVLVAILGVLVAGFVAIWKGFSERSDRMEKRLGERGARMEEQLGERGARMEERLGARITRVETRVTGALRDFMREVRDDIKAILSRLPLPEATKTSPLRLTDFGKTLSDGIAGAEWANRIADEVASQVAGMEPYEIHEFSFAYVEDDLNPSDSEEKAMRRTAYEQGARMKQILRVLAIELRDKLLARVSLEPPR